MHLIDSFLQKRFVKKVEVNDIFNNLQKQNFTKCKENNIRFSLDTLRQVLTLAHLMITPISRFSETRRIYDGYRTLSHLLISSGFSRKVVLVALTKTYRRSGY